MPARPLQAQDQGTQGIKDKLVAMRGALEEINSDVTFKGDRVSKQRRKAKESMSRKLKWRFIGPKCFKGRRNRAAKKITRSKRQRTTQVYSVGASGSGGRRNRPPLGHRVAKDMPPCNHAWDGYYLDASDTSPSCEVCQYHLVVFSVCWRCGCVRCAICGLVQYGPKFGAKLVE